MRRILRVEMPETETAFTLYTDDIVWFQEAPGWMIIGYYTHNPDQQYREAIVRPTGPDGTYHAAYIGSIKPHSTLGRMQWHADQYITAEQVILLINNEDAEVVGIRSKALKEDA